MRITPTSTAGLAATLTAGLAAALVVLVPGGAPAAAPRAVPRPALTTLTLRVHGCEGCELRLVQALSDPTHVWQSGARTVTDGVATWRVPTARTAGLSISVDAPWDGGVGAVPAVAFRYAGRAVGEHVTRAEARTARRASGCLEGTTRRRLTLGVRVVHARVPGVDGSPVRSPRAYTPTTQAWRRPMYRAGYGILGSQDAVYCARS